jgi:3-oxoacyl-[acyl-carrier-protein] synthase-3
MPHIPSTARGARFIGWGTSLGHRVVTNDDLTASMDTNDEWIRERTGIHRRHIGGSTAELSTLSGKAALQMAGIDPKSIDALILATTTPDRTVPATSATVQNALGLACGAFDVNAACSGFVYGLVVAHGLIGVGAERIMIIGTDTLSRIVDWTDRNTAPLFADGSGAAIIESTKGHGQLLGWDIDADGSAEEILYAEVGSTIQMLSLIHI